MTYWAESKELGLLRNQRDIVPLAVLESEEEKVLEAVNIIGYQGTVVCLANGGNNMATKAYAKLGDRRSDGTHISNSQSDKWLKQVSLTHYKYSVLTQARVIDGRTLSTVDTAITWSRWRLFWFLV